MNTIFINKYGKSLSDLTGTTVKKVKVMKPTYFPINVMNNIKAFLLPAKRIVKPQLFGIMTCVGDENTFGIIQKITPQFVYYSRWYLKYREDEPPSLQAFGTFKRKLKKCKEERCYWVRDYMSMLTLTNKLPTIHHYETEWINGEGFRKNIVDHFTEHRLKQLYKQLPKILEERLFWNQSHLPIKLET